MVQIATAAEEEQRYDRQIRLWGAEAQNNLRNSNILVIGLSGVGSEIVKNVVLSGINSMTLCDSRKLNKADPGQLESQMLISFQVKQSADTETKNLGQLSIPRCNELNPMVNTVAVEEIPLAEIAEKKFNIVVCCDQTRETELQVYENCQKSNTPFLCGKTAGYFGQAIIDCGKNYTCQVKQAKKTSVENSEIDDKKSNSAAGAGQNSKNDAKANDEAEEGDQFKEESSDFKPFTEIIENLKHDCFSKLKKREIKNLNQAVVIMPIIYHNNTAENFSSEAAEKMAVTMTGKDDFWTGNNANFHNLEQLSYATQGQLTAVTAIVGGFMAQEVIRVASRKEKPFENCFFFDGLNYKGDVMLI